MEKQINPNPISSMQPGLNIQLDILQPFTICGVCRQSMVCCEPLLQHSTTITVHLLMETTLH